MLSYDCKNLKKTSLQGYYTCKPKKFIQKMIQKKENALDAMRACCFISFEGSMTLEASLVFPLFVIAMVICIFYGQIFLIKGKMYHGLLEAAKVIATEEYESQRKHTSTSIFRAKSLQWKYADCQELSGIIKIGGISFLNSKIVNAEDEVELHMRYTITFQCPIIGSKKIEIKEAVCQKAFTGYQPNLFESKNQHVYVTMYGNVYHTNPQCSHIMLSISAGAEIDKYLNNETSLRPCSKCIKDKNNKYEKLYIPKDGDCFHASLECSGLKRYIKEVPLWEVEGNSLCQRCAKNMKKG